MIPHLTDAKTGKIKCLSRQAVSVYYNSEKRGKEGFLQRDKEKKRIFCKEKKRGFGSEKSEVVAGGLSSLTRKKVPDFV